MNRDLLRKVEQKLRREKLLVLKREELQELLEKDLPEGLVAVCDKPSLYNRLEIVLRLYVCNPRGIPPGF